MKDYGNALDDYSRAIEIDSDEPTAYYDRGLVYQALKVNRKAAADFSKAIKLGRKNPMTFAARANALLFEKEYAGAIDGYMKTLELDPDSAMAGNNLAWVLATCPDDRLRDGRKAVEYASKACALDGKKAYNLGTLAAACAEVGDFGRAVEWQQKALDLREGYSDEDVEKAKQRLKLYQDGMPYHDD